MNQSTIMQRRLEGAEVLYSTEIIAGARILLESRIIADLLLQYAMVREDMSKGGAR
jgi:hypothetical protein